MKMNKRLLVTSGMMLSAVAIALSTNTYAWFTMANENTLDDFTITAAAATGGLEISLDGKTFSSSSVKLTADGVKALDVTSTDGKTFYKASLDSSGQTVTALNQTSLAGIDYFETDIYFRTVAQGTIYLHQDSYVKPASTTGNQSSFGNFSRDYIAGAARLSFQVTGYQNTTGNQYTTSSLSEAKTPGKIIEPDNVVYNDDGVGKVGDANYKAPTVAYQVNKITLSQNLSTGSWSVNPNNTGKGAEEVYKISNAAKAEFSTDKVSTEGWSAKQNIVQILSSSEDFKFTTNNIQITKVTLRVWIEGQDNEAKTPLTSGSFITGLKFGLNTTATTPTKVAVTPTNVHLADDIITWDPVLGASGYEIWASTSADGKTNLTKIVASSELVHPAASYTLGATDKKYDPDAAVADDEIPYVWYGVKAIAKTGTGYSDYYKDSDVVQATAQTAE